MNSFDPSGLFKPPELPRLYGKTATAMQLVLDHGVEPRDALLLARNGKPPSPTALKDFRAKTARYSLSRPAMVKKAHNVVSDILDGKADSITTQKLNKNGQLVDVIERIAPTHTNKLAAAAMVFDRAEPVIRRNVNLNGDLKDFMPVQLTDYE